MKKRIGVLLLGLILLVNGFSWEAMAAGGDHGQEGDLPETFDQVWVNPIYQDVEDEGSLKKALEAAGEETVQQEERAGGSETFLSMKKAADSLRSQLVDRKNVITVYVEAGNTAIQKLSPTLFEAAVAVEKGTAGDEGDYIMYHLGGYGASVRRASFASSRYIVSYAVRYYTTKQQEKQVTAKVKKVLSSLGVNKMGTYSKVKAIYDYICKNVKYDNATLNDSTLGKYTAYQAIMKGTAVCQGYASLFYRMAVDAGVRARVMPGSSRSIPHAWNIVKLGSYYYNLDSTWDAGSKNYAYFLKSNRDFPDHTREKEYVTAAFNKAYPMAPTSYKKGVTATVSKYDISKAKVSGIKSKTYTGKKRTQTPTLKLGGVTLKKGQDYTVAYKNNVKIGTATITFKGKGKYSGTLKKTYKIIVKKGAVYKVGGYKYKIANASTNGKGTVRQVGAAKNVKQVKIGGKKFKVLS